MNKIDIFSSSLIVKATCFKNYSIKKILQILSVNSLVYSIFIYWKIRKRGNILVFQNICQGKTFFFHIFYHKTFNLKN